MITDTSIFTSRPVKERRMMLIATGMFWELVSIPMVRPIMLFCNRRYGYSFQAGKKG